MNNNHPSGSSGGQPSSNPELDSFREQWRAEVRARHPHPHSQAQAQAQQAGLSSSSQRNGEGSSGGGGRDGAGQGGPRKPPPPPTKRPPGGADRDEDYYVQPRAFDEQHPTTLTATGTVAGKAVSSGTEPVTALEHYEMAVEREAAGKLGDSLRLYRKAFRMDDAVDQQYKNKHFPKPAPKPPAPVTTAGPVVEGVGAAAEPQSVKDLIASFAGLGIEPSPPMIEGTPPPPCPIAHMPHEILVFILLEVAALDVGDFVRLAQVCKRFAYLVATEDRIWRRVCLGSQFGFGGMHYHWQQQVAWGALTWDDLVREAEGNNGPTEEGEEAVDKIPASALALRQRAERHAVESEAATLRLYRSLYKSSWQRMFRLRPRVRFNGCYISTVNYIRAGMANANSVTWNSPVHIVTYYRYLRFFRDGTVLSLLTTAEPADVVHHVTRDAAALHAGGAHPHLPGVVMQSALRGRWRLARNGKDDEEGDLVVETEGVSNYIYRLDLSLRSAGTKGGTGTRNNKLVWRGFYSYDRLRDDWAEFALKNDKPFFFSRVRSYGVLGA
ncbi:hypothetical protein QBC47DRAFT_375857 [Echria macrotheca]|uniref:F-box domain-containing protein n=1 Tax=Echria macrotheca TaxID=438768 RepID=A0AAJ0BFL3_9PEZI|nr:hypothetical protein QBC47DRAFT_375857 [Echria macrotheca]